MTLRRAIATGQLQASKITRRYRIRPEWVDAWLESRVVGRRDA
jgi:excisionase family DNA binding protein